METEGRAKLKSYAWLAALSMLLALFVPLASAGGAQEEEPPTGQTAEDGGTLDATPESATNRVDEAHDIHASLGDPDEAADNEGETIIGEVDDPDPEKIAEPGPDDPDAADSYDGGLEEGTQADCQTEDPEEEDHSAHCDLTFNEDGTAESGKDRIRVFHDDNENGTWDEDEDFDFVTKTWVSEDDAADLEVLAGETRIQTAVQISQDKWAAHDELIAAEHEGQEHADAVVIARADNFPDALAGSPFAVGVNGPLLLTFPHELHEDTEEELRRVLDEDAEEAETVYLLGQTDAISLAVEAQIQELGYETERLGGLTRFETAVEIAETTEERQGSLDDIFIARSHLFPDSLTGGAAAANVDPDNGNVGAIVLTLDQTKHPTTEAFLNDEDRAEATTYALAGPAFNPYSCAVDVDHDQDGETDTWLTQSRCEDDEDADPEETADWAIFGGDRHETGRAIAEFFFVDPVDVGIARSDDFPDALTGGAHIGQFNGPILLTPTNSLHQDAERYLCFTADTIGTGYVYGGDHAVAPDTRTEVDDAIDGGDVCTEHDLPGHWVGS